MENEIVIGLLSLAGTAIGTGGGIIASSKLTNYRLKKLEEKVDKHNKFAERMPVLEEKMEVANHRITDLEEGHEKNSERITKLSYRR